MMILSVCMITYNHERYIRDAIEGVIMQKTDFQFELVIGEDCSTDHTLNICKEYLNKYPDLIKLLTVEKNIGAMPNMIRTINSCNGKYIAFCEGDDYWINPNKLQKQVDFLARNIEYSVCFHEALILWDDKSKPPKYFCPPNQNETSTIEDVVDNNWFVPSASIVFRNEIIKPLPDWFNNIHNGDFALLLLLANKGKIGYINEVMSIYRKSENSLSAGIGKNYILIDEKIIQLLSLFNNFSEYKFDRLIKEKIYKLQQEIRYLSLRKKIPFYKYFNKRIWVQKTINIFNNILTEGDKKS